MPSTFITRTAEPAGAGAGSAASQAPDRRHRQLPGRPELRPWVRGSRRGSQSGNTRLKELEPQGIGDNAHRAEAHGGSGEHGIELESEGDKQHARSQRDADGVVEEGPEQILLDVADHGTAQFHGRHGIPQIIFHQNNICALHGYIRACTNSHAYICGCQCRGASLMPSPIMATLWP